MNTTSSSSSSSSSTIANKHVFTNKADLRQAFIEAEQSGALTFSVGIQGREAKVVIDGFTFTWVNTSGRAFNKKEAIQGLWKTMVRHYKVQVKESFQKKSSKRKFQKKVSKIGKISFYSLYYQYKR